MNTIVHIISQSHVEKDTVDYSTIIVKIDMSDSVNVNTSEEWSIFLTTLIEGGVQKILLDMSSLRFIDSCGIGMLINVTKILRSHKGEIAFMRVNSGIEDLFNLVHLQRFIKMFDTEKEAVNFFTIYV